MDLNLSFKIDISLISTMGKVSSPLPLTSGVSQGFNAVPLLFVLYINYIFDVSTSFVKVYAYSAKHIGRLSQ